MQQQVESDLRLSDLQSDLTERGSHGLTFHSGGGGGEGIFNSIHTNYLSKVAGPIDNSLATLIIIIANLLQYTC